LEVNPARLYRAGHFDHMLIFQADRDLCGQYRRVAFQPSPALVKGVGHRSP